MKCVWLIYFIEVKKIIVLIWCIFRYLDNKVFVFLVNGDLIVYKRDNGEYFLFFEF